MKPLSVFSPIKGPTGYDGFARDLLEGLDKAGVEVALNEFVGWSPYEIQLRPEQHDVLGRALAKKIQPGPEPVTNLSICLPEQAQVRDECRNIIYTMFESDAICTNWGEQLQHLDKVIVPTEFNRWSFSRSGLLPAEKIDVLPIGINLERFNPTVEPLPLIHGTKPLTDYPVRFLLVLELSDRKNFWGALLTFYSVAALIGPDQCCLLMKIGSYSKQMQLKTDIEEFRKQAIRKGEIPDADYNVFNYTPLLPDEALPHFIRLGTHYLSTSFGEGWDMTAMQAAACGLHLFVPKHSAYQCWLDMGVCTFLPIARKTEASMAGPLQRLYCGSNWVALDLVASVHIIASNVVQPAIIDTKRHRMREFIKRYSWPELIPRYIEALYLQ